MSDLDTGQRLRTLRERRGFSREQLAAIAEVSASTIKSIEMGRRSLTLKMAGRLAPILGITDYGELYGPQVHLPLEASVLARHPAVPEVRKALTSWGTGLPDGRPETGEYLRGWIDNAWSTWHTSPNQRTETGRILPKLLEATERSALLTEPGPARSQVLAMQAQAFHLAQAYLAWHGERELVYLTVDRGMLAARESGDPLAIGSSVWYAAAVLRAIGRADEALDNLAQARDLVVRHEPAGAGEERERAAVLADLWLRSALTRARAGDRNAWQDLDAANEIVQRLPETYQHPWTKVGRVLVDVKRVMVAVEFGDPDEVRRVAQGIDPQSIPSTERRARHLIEVARALNMEGSPEAVLHLLSQAAAVSAETVAFTPAGRDLAEKVLRSSGATTRQEAQALARLIGLEV